jgi:regulator of cell morphogenesis and NO signaling
LPEIEQSIAFLLENYSSRHPLLNILHSFYRRYAAELTSHIELEETYMLPYIKYLLTIEQQGLDTTLFFTYTKTYSIEYLIKNHNDTETELANVRQAIKLYDPPKTNHTPYRILISQLHSLEKDLSIHALIEDRILMPEALNMEKKYLNQFLETVRWN